MSENFQQPARKKKRPKIGGLLGIGLDNEDGHKRITTGEKFVLVGGSQETHEAMTETVLKTFEELRRRDQPLESVDHHELGEIIEKSRPR